MARRFITERDIAAYAAQGMTELVVEPDMVLTDLAVERARAAKLCLITPEVGGKAPASTAGSAPPATTDALHAQIRKAVIARLGSEPEGLDAIIKGILPKLS
jgi:hypothetical protein